MHRDCTCEAISWVSLFDLKTYDSPGTMETSALCTFCKGVRGDVQALRCPGEI